MTIETVSDGELNVLEQWEIESNRLDHGAKMSRCPALVRVRGKREAIRCIHEAINEAMELGQAKNMDYKDHGDMVVLCLSTTEGWRVFRAAKVTN